MDRFKLYQQHSSFCILLTIVLSNMLLALLWFGFLQDASFGRSTAYLVLIIGVIIIAVTLSTLVTSVITAPFKVVWQGILHVSRHQNSVGAPSTDQLQVGKTVAANLLAQVYELASSSSLASDNSTDTAHLQELAHQALKTLPLPMLVLDESQKITYANEAAHSYFEIELSDMVGKNVNDVAHMLFPSELTLERWLEDSSKQTITSSQTWERVRIANPENKPQHQCDLIAYYNKGLGEAITSSLVFFDRSNAYDHNDEEMSFVALAVHELRTPLTIMRGYIEVFEEEFEGKLSEEMTSFMHKLSASAQALSAFISNILNVSRVENNQLVLHLEEHDWQKLLHIACDDMEMRAKVRGKHFVYNVHTQLPTIAVDRVSIYEVLSNLLDNAVKYSGDSKEIVISSRVTTDGMIETTIQDSGSGIPTSIMPHLFDKFYRNHRSRDQIGGTGLGLFLCKAIIEAHGGNIWVKSKEGEGSTFGFTLQSYSSVANNQQNNNNGGITRDSHGWIKNHSLYRR